MLYGIVGYSGQMGRELAALFENAGHKLVLEVDADSKRVHGSPQVIVDFSLPAAWPSTLSLCREHGSALVLGTTGLDAAQAREARELADAAAVVHSSNYGVGTNLLAMILQNYGPMFSDWEMEVIEAHHNRKKDAPSGTAKMLMEAAGRDCPTHSLRLGNLPGDHSVCFALGDEVLTFTHHAVNRSMFARGAMKAAEFAVSAAPGYYSFQDVLRAARR